MALKIEMLRCFVAVADSGNLSDAGVRLGRSVSAVSMMLKQLEDHLGNPLFETDRKSKLSPVGIFVLDQARAEVGRFDRTVETIERFAQGGAGDVRLASVPSVAGTILPVALRQMVSSRPRVKIQLRDMDSEAVVNALMRGQVDIGIGSVPDGMVDFSRVVLFKDRFGVVCCADHPLARAQGPLHWEHLLAENFVANDLAGSIKTPVFQGLYRGATMHVPNTVSLLAMVRAGLGITVLPRLAMQTNADGLVFRRVADQSAIRQIDLVHRSGNTLSPAAETLKSVIVDTARNFRDLSDH